MMIAALTRNFFSQKKEVFRITSSAAHRLKHLMSQQQNPNFIGIKIGLKRKGCNGLAYTMDYAERKEKLDEVVEREGVKVIVDSKALMALIGTEMDYVDNEVGAEFVFTNPNSKGSCGCGESFHI